jgi:hypothetical protein
VASVGVVYDVTILIVVFSTWVPESLAPTMDVATAFALLAYVNGHACIAFTNASPTMAWTTLAIVVAARLIANHRDGLVIAA